MSSGARVVVVASEDTAAAWVERLLEEGVPARALPWSTVVPGPDVARAARALAGAASGGAGARPAVLLTSRNGARFLPPRSGGGLEAIVVGPATAEAARAAGFAVGPGAAADAGPDADSAAGFASVARRLLAASSAPRTAFWLRGDAATREGVDLLGAAGWRIEEFATYVATPRPAFEAEVRALVGVNAWVVGSPAAARALVAALGADAFPPPAGGPPVFVPGETTAAALAVAGRVAPEVVRGLPEGLAARLSARA